MSYIITKKNIFLFSYGTLQLEKVRLEVFGRYLKGKEDAIIGYRTDMVKIKDKDVIQKSGKDFHPIVIKSDDATDLVPGKVFLITKKELSLADKYEVSDYTRIKVMLQSGKEAWTYVKS